MGTDPQVGLSADLTPVDALLADGSTVRVRVVTDGDRLRMKEFHSALSTGSRFYRYFGAHPALTDRDLDRICRCGADDLTLLAERDGRIVALAEYHRAPESEGAEVAFVVDDLFQGRGIATVLLEHLASAARRNGVRRLVADTLVENSKMLDVFKTAGFAEHAQASAGVVHVVLDVDPTPASLASSDDRDRHAIVSSMARLLRPRSIAVIGASRRPGSIGHELVGNLVDGSFVGPVYPVNPNAVAVASVPCWAAVGDIAAEVDLAVIAVPAASVVDVVEQCGHKGVGALVIISSGFAETGPEGLDLQRRVTALSHQWGMRIVGPNCFGVLNTDPSVRMNATFARDRPRTGRVGFASQSGGLGIAILGEARRRGLGMSTFVSMGNKADVSGNDLITWWEQDPQTDVALLYLESFGNPRKFSRIARRVGQRKPIVAVKSGRSAAGAIAAASHTAALASSDQAVDALFAQCGVIRVDTVEELFDVAEVLAHQPVPGGARIGIVTNAGGPGVLAADACSGAGLTVPALSSEAQSALRGAIPGAASVVNPIDLAASATPQAFTEAVRQLVGGGEVDSVLTIFTPPLTTTSDGVARAIVAAGDESPGSDGVAIVSTFFGSDDARDVLSAARHPIPCFTYPETAVRAIGHAARYGRWRSHPLATAERPSGMDRVAALDALSKSGPGGWLTGTAAMAVLAAYGIPTVPTEEVHTSEQAADAVSAAGVPCALKALGSQILHKSERGGVRLDVMGPDDARSTYEDMTARLGPAMSGAMVQSMAAKGIETIAGFVQDRQIGPVLLFGLGGTAVELLDDHCVRLAPVAEVEAREMVLSIRGAPLLTGYRGSPGADLGQLADVMVRLSWLAEELPEIAEADCNPVIAGPHGAVVVDARLRVAAVDAARADDRRRLR